VLKPVNLSAATLGLEWTKTALSSVQTSLQAETNAVMEGLKTVSGDSETDDVGRLRRRGMLLKDQHRSLLSLLKRFKLQGKRVLQICNGDQDHWSSEVELSENVEPSVHSEDTDGSETVSSQQTSSEQTPCEKHVRTCDDADVSSESVCTRRQQISVTSLSHIASLESVANNRTDGNIINETVSDEAGCTGNTAGRTVVTWLGASYSSHSGDDDMSPACGADADGSCSARSQSCHQSNVLQSVLARCSGSSLGHTCMAVTCQHVHLASDCRHHDTQQDHGVIVQRPVTTAVSVPYSAAAPAAAAASSRSSLMLSVCDSLPSSQPICQLSEPAAKKLRLPPPSPSLLSISSISPPVSPLHLPVSGPLYSSLTRCPTAAAAPRYQATTHVKLPVSQQPSRYLHASDARMLPQSLRTEPSSRAFVVSTIAQAHSVSLPASVPTASTTAAVARPAASCELSASQCSQRSLMKNSQRPCFSLRQLIGDDIIHPGHNVLSVQNSVTVCRQFCRKILTRCSC